MSSSENIRSEIIDYTFSDILRKFQIMSSSSPGGGKRQPCWWRFSSYKTEILTLDYVGCSVWGVLHSLYVLCFIRYCLKMLVHFTIFHSYPTFHDFPLVVTSCCTGCRTSLSFRSFSLDMMNLFSPWICIAISNLTLINRQSINRFPT